LAFGANAYELLKRHLNPARYRALVPLTHYSHRVPKEDYREESLARIAETLSAIELV
jgi:hypothetical protein